MRVLMSLNNLGHFNSQFSLAVVDTEDEAGLRLIDCQGFLDFRKDGGITGLCVLPEGGLALAVQGPKPKVVFLNPDWSVRKIVQDPRFSDVHSITYRDGYLFVASTGVNKILKIALDGFAVSLFWEYAVDTPMLHINALVFDGERPMVSSHKTPPECVGGAQSGGCWYLDNYEVAIDGLTQPHALMKHGNAFYCLSSHDSRVARRSAKGEVSFFETQGYPRGMAFIDGQVLIGVSSKRFVSRKRSGVFKYADFRDVIGNPLYMSGLTIANARFRTTRTINLTPVTFEIYDVIADPGVPANLLVAAAGPIRMQTMQRLVISLREQVDLLRSEAAGEAEPSTQARGKAAS